MERTDWSEFCRILDEVSEVMGHAKMVGPGLVLFFDVLSPYSIQDVKWAMHEHLRACRFFPKPAEIIQLIEGTAEDRGRFAWQKALKACEAVGVYRSVRFEDPRIHYAVIQMGGWVKFGQMLESERPFREKDFLRHYRDAERMGLTWGQVSEHLPGHCEIENAMGGHDTEPPLLGNAPMPKLRAVEEPAMIGSGKLEDHSVEADAMIADVIRSVRVS